MTAPAERVSDDPNAMTVSELRRRLGIGDAGDIRKVGGKIVSMDLRGTGITDLAPLRGLPLRELYLEETVVGDIAPLEGMPLEKLYLSRTQVANLSPLEGMQLEELNLVGAPVEDLSPLARVELGTLWLAETRVRDLTPLSGKEFVSLDVQDTDVADLAPLATCRSLQRLNIAGTPVTDVTPLAGLQLERLILTPDRIKSGMDHLRTMTSLRGIDTQFDGVSPVKEPDEFWNLYDAGELSRP
jgi:hypothetical protein